MRNLIFICIFVVFYGLVHVAPITTQAPTLDEPVYIAAGYFTLSQKSLLLNPYHPPLIKIISAVPIFFRAEAVDVNSFFSTGIDYRKFYQYFFNNLSISIQETIVYARVVVTLFNLLLLGILSYYVVGLFGPALGAILISILSFNPNFLANFHLVTLDVASLLIITVIIFKTLTLKTDSIKLPDLLLLCIYFLFAYLIKAPSIIFSVGVSMMVLLYIIAFRKNVSFYLKYLVCSLIIPILLISIVYNLLIPISHLNSTRQYQRDVRNNIPYLAQKIIALSSDNPLTHGLSWYLTGISAVSNYTFEYKGTKQVLFGQVRTEPKNDYFFQSFIVKESEGFWLICLAGMIGIVLLFTSSYTGAPFFGAFFIMTIPIFYYSKLDLGARYMLPLYAFIILGVGIFCQKFLLSRKTMLVFLLVCSVFQAVFSLRAFPDFLSFSSVSTGNSVRTEYYASDSSFDWGQDTFRLVNYMQSSNAIISAVDIVQPFDFKQYYPIFEGQESTIKKILASNVCKQKYAVSKQRLTRILLLDPLQKITLQNNFSQVAEIGKTILLLERNC